MDKFHCNHRRWTDRRRADPLAACLFSKVADRSVDRSAKKRYVCGANGDYFSPVLRKSTGCYGAVLSARGKFPSVLPTHKMV